MDCKLRAKNCGGCPMLGMDYATQLKQKEETVKKLLGRFGPVEHIRGMETPYHYRNKVISTFTTGWGGKLTSGIYAANSHKVLPVESCLLQDEVLDKTMLAVRAAAGACHYQPFNEDKGTGLLRHCLLRRGVMTGQVMVVLVTAQPVLPGAKNFVKALLTEAGKQGVTITTIVQNVNSRRTSVVLGEAEKVLYGKGFILDTLCGKTYAISPRSFYQINHAQTEVLYGLAVDAAKLTGKEVVLDAYCGIGTIGLTAADHAKQVVGVELNRDAVHDAIGNTELIKSKPEWSLAGIYADEAITGTQVKKREDFQRLINDCMNGDVDMVITKSISRFARNTLDTLKYVRMLKDKGVAVFFEEENINTLTMDGELLLVILSSVAQQEVENISANVKKGLKMKMQRGELVGFQGCLGYDYNPEDKTLTVNEEEAAVVRYIFQRYTEGAGGSVIAKELENLGYKTKRGSPKWADSTVIGIIKNEKYKGDILLGKTFTVDPISKRRLYNFGEEDQFYIREHHEPIISEEVFEAAQEILRRRAKPRSLNVDGKREKFSRKYAFSCMIECGFCGGTLTRRSWHSSSQYNKAIWQCVVSTKKGKKFCPESKGVDERTIERAFVESYRLLCQNNKDVLDEFMKRTEEALSESNAGKRLAKAEKDIHALEVKKNKLVDMRLEDTIDKETYDRKYLDLSSQIEQLQKECESLQDAAETESTMRKRVATFRQTLEQNEVLDTFDRHIFESIVEKVIVGGYDSNGNKDPYMIVFVYKTGFKNSVDGKNFKPLRKNSKENHSPAVLCSHASNEAESMCSDSSDDTYRDGMRIVQTRCLPEDHGRPEDG